MGVVLVEEGRGLWPVTGVEQGREGRELNGKQWVAGLLWPATDVRQEVGGRLVRALWSGLSTVAGVHGAALMPTGACRGAVPVTCGIWSVGGGAGVLGRTMMTTDRRRREKSVP